MSSELNRHIESKAYMEQISQFICLPEPPIQELKDLSNGEQFNTRQYYEFKDRIGNGNFDYISNLWNREMLENAWQAITLTNMWDFVAQDIDSFMFSLDPRLDIIGEKMAEIGYNGHSGISFGRTMRQMQYLARFGEEKFKETFDKVLLGEQIHYNEAREKVLNYMGGN
jgi:hypothetical protein